MRRRDRMRNLNNYDKAKTDAVDAQRGTYTRKRSPGIEARTKEGTREKGP